MWGLSLAHVRTQFSSCGDSDVFQLVEKCREMEELMLIITLHNFVTHHCEKGTLLEFLDKIIKMATKQAQADMVSIILK